MDNNIDAIVFDLGKVIVDVSPEKTFSKFKQICKVPHNQIDNFFKNEKFILFEQGKLNENDFFAHLKEEFFFEKNIHMLKDLWNEMIIGISSENIHILKTLIRDFKIFALSNTNFCHIKTINSHLKKYHKIKDIKLLFTKVYYSCVLKMSKPDIKIFEFVLKDNNIAAHKILFIDDNLENITVSQRLGFNTIHLQNMHSLRDELIRWGLIRV